MAITVNPPKLIKLNNLPMYVYEIILYSLHI